MKNALSRSVWTTTVIVCAVVVLLCSGIFSLARAQESEEVGTEEQTPAVSTPSGYTTEFIDDVAGVVAGDFVVGPGKSELTIEPGQSKRVEMIITNRTGDTREFKLEVVLENAIVRLYPVALLVLTTTCVCPYEVPPVRDAMDGDIVTSLAVVSNEISAVISCVTSNSSVCGESCARPTDGSRMKNDASTSAIIKSEAINALPAE